MGPGAGWSASATVSTPTLPDPALGARHVDVEGMYNIERFRPRYAGLLGHPMLLGEPVPMEG